MTSTRSIDEAQFDVLFREAAALDRAGMAAVLLAGCHRLAGYYQAYMCSEFAKDIPAGEPDLEAELQRGWAALGLELPATRPQPFGLEGEEDVDDCERDSWFGLMFIETKEVLFRALERIVSDVGPKTLRYRLRDVTDILAGLDQLFGDGLIRGMPHWSPAFEVQALLRYVRMLQADESLVGLRAVRSAAEADVPLLSLVHDKR